MIGLSVKDIIHVSEKLIRKGGFPFVLDFVFIFWK